MRGAALSFFPQKQQEPGIQKAGRHVYYFRGPINWTNRMGDRDLAVLLQSIRRTAAEVGGVSDSELLQRFVATRDEAAFELLMWRHAGLVFGVCRRVLRDVHDAEDAFQATMLILARRAGRIHKQDALAGWLYKVAY